MPEPTPRPTAWPSWTPALLALLLAALTVCRPILFSGFNHAPGDEGDGRIMVFLLESTWRALRAGHSPLSPPMFAPTQGVLGYTDAHLLWVPGFGLLRLLGLDPVRAYSAIILAALAWGLLTCWELLRRVGLAGWPAAVAAFLFAFGSPMQMKLNHAQMAGAAMLPSVLLLLHLAWTRRRAWPAVAAGVLTGLLAATSFVVTWFFLFQTLIAAAVGLVLLPEMRAALRTPRVWRLLAAAACGLVLGLVPFAVIYGPLLLHGPRREPIEANAFRPLVSDLLNLGTRNPVWTPLLRPFGIPVLDPQTMTERVMGSSPPVWLLAVAGFVLLWRGRRMAGLGPGSLLVAAIAGAGCTLLEFRYGAHLWPWVVVFHLVPGADAVRNIFRSEVVTMLAIAGLMGVALDRLWRGGHRAWFAVLAMAALLEAVFQHPPASLRASDQIALVEGAPAPPAGCRMFALAPQPAGVRSWWQLQSDALMLALHWRLPTMNGNNSWMPPGWDLHDPGAPGYVHVLSEWVQANSLAPVACYYQASTRRWVPSPIR